MISVWQGGRPQVAPTAISASCVSAEDCHMFQQTLRGRMISAPTAAYLFYRLTTVPSLDIIFLSGGEARAVSIVYFIGRGCGADSRCGAGRILDVPALDSRIRRKSRVLRHDGTEPVSDRLVGRRNCLDEPENTSWHAAWNGLGRGIRDAEFGCDVDAQFRLDALVLGLAIFFGIGILVALAIAMYNPAGRSFALLWIAVAVILGLVFSAIFREMKNQNCRKLEELFSDCIIEKEKQ